MRSWLSKCLSFLTLIPVVFLVLYIIANLTKSYHSLRKANDTITNAVLVSYTSQLVHEMQKERGMSAGFIGSKGKSFARQIQEQRRLTDARLNDLQSFYDGDDYRAVSKRTMAELFDRVNQLPAIRAQVDALSISLPDVLSYYTANNKLILDLNGTLATQLEETAAAAKFLTLYNISNAKEQAGIERAVLSNVFGRGSFTPALLLRYYSLKTKQGTYLDNAMVVVDEDFRGALKAFINSSETRDVERLRQIAENSEGGFGVTPEAWFAAATARINNLKDTEQNLTDHIADYASAKVMTRRIAIFLELVVLTLATAIAYAVFTTIKMRAAQAKEISRVMHAVDKHKNLTEQADIITQDDLGQIAELINKTFFHVREDLQRFQANAIKINQASTRTAAATEQSKHNLIQLQLDISGIATATAEMTASIQEVLSNMERAADNAQEAANETCRGETALNTAVDGIGLTASEVSKMGQTIEDLNERVNDILVMVDVIKSVADQTNLLALNAAIEAARAGEQGRGFAVVADEVRSLAKRTQNSTEEISKVVNVLRESSQNAFSSIETGNKTAQNAVERANEITRVLNKIVVNISNVDLVTQTISQSSKEQNALTTSVNTSVANIDQQARENVIGAEQVAAASMQLSGVAQDMEDRLSIYKVS